MLTWMALVVVSEFSATFQNNSLTLQQAKDMETFCKNGANAFINCAEAKKVATSTTFLFQVMTDTIEKTLLRFVPFAGKLSYSIMMNNALTILVGFGVCLLMYILRAVSPLDFALAGGRARRIDGGALHALDV